jgi:hypothetical protein
MTAIHDALRSVGPFFGKNLGEIEMRRNKVTKMARICTESDNALIGNSLSLTHNNRRS